MPSEIYKYIDLAKSSVARKDKENFIKNISIAEYLAKNDKELSKIVLLEQVNGHYKLGLYDNLFEYIGILLSSENLEYSIKTEVLRKKGVALGKLGMYDKATAIFEQFIKEDSVKTKVFGYGNLIWILLQKYDSTKEIKLLNIAADYSDKGIELVRQLNDQDDLLREMLNNQVIIYWNNEKYEVALDIFLQVKEMGETTAILNNIAATYVSLGKKEEAMEYLKKAISIASKECDHYELGYNNFILARIEEEINEDYMKAKDYYFVALDQYILAKAYCEVCKTFDNIFRLTEVLNRESMNFLAKSFRSHYMELAEIRVSKHEYI